MQDMEQRSKRENLLGKLQQLEDRELEQLLHQVLDKKTTPKDTAAAGSICPHCGQEFQPVLTVKGNEPSPDQPSKIIPLLPPSELSVPEVYVITYSGTPLFHFDFLGQFNQEPVDKDLVAGFLGAINMFAENMGWAEGISSIKSGNNLELRFAKGEFIFIVLVSRIKHNQSFIIEPVLKALTDELCRNFEERFQRQLTQEVGLGIIDSAHFREFVKDIETFFIQYRRENFELYQKLILVESMYLGVPEEACVELIQRLSTGRSVIGELGGIMTQNPKVGDAIFKVNHQLEPMWLIFSTPTYRV